MNDVIFAISVPLDYFNKSAGTARIALARFRATASPRKGIILFNPGGPGKFRVSWGDILQTLSTVIGGSGKALVASRAGKFLQTLVSRDNILFGHLLKAFCAGW